MKNSISAFVVLIFLGTMAHAQNQSLFKTDTTAVGKLGLSKKNAWSLLPLLDAIIVKDFDFTGIKNGTSRLITSFHNMPVFVPESEHSMPIHYPDTTVTYKKRIFGVD